MLYLVILKTNLDKYSISNLSFQYLHNEDLTLTLRLEYSKILQYRPCKTYKKNKIGNNYLYKNT